MYFVVSTLVLREQALIQLFEKYNNTPVPSNAAVERFFSMGKDIFRAKIFFC
jgi:hypothetical protein